MAVASAPWHTAAGPAGPEAAAADTRGEGLGSEVAAGCVRSWCEGADGCTVRLAGLPSDLAEDAQNRGPGQGRGPVSLLRLIASLGAAAVEVKTDGGGGLCTGGAVKLRGPEEAMRVALALHRRTHNHCR